MTDLHTHIDRSIRESIATHQTVLELAPSIAAAAELLAQCYRNGNKALFYGNGGSAADAQHLAAELESRFAFDRAPLAAMALHANTSTLTAVANDYAYDQVFARLIRAHARPGDVAVALSTSGTSRNVVAAAKVGRELGIGLVALTGEHAATLAEYANVVIAVPSRVTGRIQECHILIGHILCEWIERAIFAKES